MGRTLDSAISQKRIVSLRVVVVDDGSTDRTYGILEAAAARDSRIRYLRGTHAGTPAARNFAISQSRGSLSLHWTPTIYGIQTRLHSR